MEHGHQSRHLGGREIQGQVARTTVLKASTARGVNLVMISVGPYKPLHHQCCFSVCKLCLYTSRSRLNIYWAVFELSDVNQNQYEQDACEEW
jgi:hypothetical protein